MVESRCSLAYPPLEGEGKRISTSAVISTASAFTGIGNVSYFAGNSRGDNRSTFSIRFTTNS